MRTNAQALALFQDLRDNYSTFFQTTGLDPLSVAGLLIVLLDNLGGGGGGTITTIDRELRLTVYEATTTSAGNWAPGDVLERLQMIDVSGGGATVVSTQWLRQDGTTLVTVPVIGTDVILLDRVQANASDLLAIIAANTTPAAPFVDPRPNIQRFDENAGANPAIGNTTPAPAPGTAQIRALYYANGATLHYLQAFVGTTPPQANAIPTRTFYKAFANSSGGLDEAITKDLFLMTVPTSNSVYFVRSSTPDVYTPLAVQTGNNRIQTQLVVEVSW